MPAFVVKILIFLRYQIALNWAIPEMLNDPIIMKFNCKSDKNFRQKYFSAIFLDINRVAWIEGGIVEFLLSHQEGKLGKWKMRWIWKSFGIFFLLFGVTFACVSLKNLHFTSGKKEDERLSELAWKKTLRGCTKIRSHGSLKNWILVKILFEMFVKTSDKFWTKI